MFNEKFQMKTALDYDNLRKQFSKKKVTSIHCLTSLEFISTAVVHEGLSDHAWRG